MLNKKKRGFTRPKFRHINILWKSWATLSLIRYKEIIEAGFLNFNHNQLGTQELNGIERTLHLRNRREYSIHNYNTPNSLSIIVFHYLCKFYN
jgi:hypothetical protein